MFVDIVYANRRNILKHRVGKGIIWLQGNDMIGMNYSANCYPFRQDSSFLYYTGINRPGLNLIIDVDQDQCTLFGDEYELDELVWIGPQTKLHELAAQSGITSIRPKTELGKVLQDYQAKSTTIHTLPSYQGNHRVSQIENLGTLQKPSMSLVEAVISQRSIKEDREVVEMENAVSITALLHIEAMKMANSGVREMDIMAKVTEITLAHDCQLGYPAIVTINGDVLHMNDYPNELKKGQLLLCDMGVTTNMGYTADITRTTPVDRSFDQRQRDIYSIVLDALETATNQCMPGTKYKDIHLSTCRLISDGLKAVGLMKGNVEEAVAAGAHALFMPHGLGHMIGMDVHDMENLGEDHVGYDGDVSRSSQFGLAYLRMGKELLQGNVITVEPGIYFIKPLFEKWKSENKFTEFLNYDAIESYMGLGGIRIEDNILITKTGARVLGPKIPKSIAEIENI